jgi:hypothetical protein
MRAKCQVRGKGSGRLYMRKVRLVRTVMVHLKLDDRQPFSHESSQPRS